MRNEKWKWEIGEAGGFSFLRGGGLEIGDGSNGPFFFLEKKIFGGWRL